MRTTTPRGQFRRADLPGPSAAVEDWRNQAACRDVDPELFFPHNGYSELHADIVAAKATCQGCSVRVECLRWALDVGDGHAVLGGLTANERRNLTRRMRRGTA